MKGRKRPCGLKTVDTYVFGNAAWKLCTQHGAAWTQRYKPVVERHLSALLAVGDRR